MIEPHYPVFVPSKGRYDNCLTARFLLADGCPFRLVVEPAEESEYRSRYPAAEIVVTPRDEMRLLGVRNWIRELAESEGHAQHWQIDDNINHMRRWHEGRRIPCDSRYALAMMERFADRYENVGLAGPNYQFFAIGKTANAVRINAHVYSCTLVNHAMPARWRLLYNDDTDLCLQALATGWATLQFQSFLIYKRPTMTVSGGNTDDLYQGDGRLVMARALERVWPGVVRVDRRFKRPQHVVDWAKFDVPLVRRTDIDWDAIAGGSELETVGLRRVRPPRHRDGRRGDSLRTETGLV